MKVAVDVSEMEQAKGFNESKDRLSFMLTVNGTGTDRWEMLIINKVLDPENDVVLDEGIQWYANKKGWMTSPIFRHYLVEFDRYVRDHVKHLVLLLVDNCSSHLIAKTLKLTHVLVAFLPANSTAHLQPLDAGIIKSIKQEYYSLVGQNIAEELLRNGLELELTPKAAANHLKQALSHLTCNQIKSAFNATGIMTEVHRSDMEHDEKEAPAPSIVFGYNDDDYELERHCIAQETYESDLTEEINSNMSLRSDQTEPVMPVNQISPLVRASRKRKRTTTLSSPSPDNNTEQPQSRPRTE